MEEHPPTYGLARIAEFDPEKEERGMRVIIGRHWGHNGVRWTAEATSVPAYETEAATEQEARKLLADMYRLYADQIEKPN